MGTRPASFRATSTRRPPAIGYMGLGFPEQYGGTEGDRFMRIIAMQEIALGAAASAFHGLFSHTIGAPPIPLSPRLRGDEGASAAANPRRARKSRCSPSPSPRAAPTSPISDTTRAARRRLFHRQWLQDIHHLGNARRLSLHSLSELAAPYPASGVSLLLIEGDPPEGLQRTSP